MVRIGVTTGYVGKARPRYLGLHDGYIRGLLAAGATPVIWPSTLGEGDPEEVSERAKELLAEVDGLVLTGGGDVDPARYGEERGSARIYGVDPARDAFEIALVRAAAPWAADGAGRVLAICRGLQVLVVGLGGTLHQDLEEAGYDRHSRSDREYEAVHRVDIEAGSRLAGVLGTEAAVNSLHHQAVKDLGTGLRAVAWSPDGVVEAAEAEGILAVQWHPERLLETDEGSRALFRWVVGGGGA
jgi:putative glutamine amidotransferase